MSSVYPALHVEVVAHKNRLKPWDTEVLKYKKLQEQVTLPERALVVR